MYFTIWPERIRLHGPLASGHVDSILGMAHVYVSILAVAALEFLAFLIRGPHFPLCLSSNITSNITSSIDKILMIKIRVIEVSSTLELNHGLVGVNGVGMR